MSGRCINKRCAREIDDTFVFCPYCGRKQTRETHKAMRMPNGCGSVIKLSGRRRKPWALRVTDYILDGKQKYRYIGYYETKTEALAALAREQISPSAPRSGILFSELYDEWRLTAAYTGLSKATQDNYRAAYKHLAPLHGKRFGDIRTAHMQRLIDEARVTVGKANERQMSPSGKAKIKLLLNLLYKYAVQNDICDKNYAEFIKVHREAKRKKEIFTENEINILEKNDFIPYTDTILILIYTGMRISEMLGLNKNAIDWENETITGGLKTDAGRERVIPIHAKIKKYLRHWYEQSDGVLFFKNDHEAISANYYREYIYYPLLEKLGIARKTPHTTRHTCATLLSMAGADTLAIEQILGHTDYAFTADTYTHVDVSFLRQAIDKI